MLNVGLWTELIEYLLTEHPMHVVWSTELVDFRVYRTERMSYPHGRTPIDDRTDQRKPLWLVSLAVSQELLLELPCSHNHAFSDPRNELSYPEMTSLGTYTA